MAYRLDYWIYGSRPSISQGDFGVGIHLTWMAFAFFAVLLMAGLLLVWVWFTQRQVAKHPVVSLIYVVLGGMMPIYSVAMLAISMSINSPSFVVYFSIPPLSLASFTSVFLFVFGLQRLVLKQSAL